jgi:hypothetical protein
MVSVMNFFACVMMRNEAKITSETSRHNFAQICGIRFQTLNQPFYFGTHELKKKIVPLLSGMAIFSHRHRRNTAIRFDWVRSGAMEPLTPALSRNGEGELTAAVWKHHRLN